MPKCYKILFNEKSKIFNTFIEILNKCIENFSYLMFFVTKFSFNIYPHVNL